MHAPLPSVLSALALSASFTVSLHAQAPVASSDTTQADSVTIGGMRVPARAAGANVTVLRAADAAHAPAGALEGALAARMPGVLASGALASAGAGGVTLLLRGPASVTVGSDPLYVVDGVITDHGASLLEDSYVPGRISRSYLADVDPADVERVEVLRGPAATALYGARAAHGAVLVHTKRGTPGRPAVTVQTRAASQAVRTRLDVNRAPLDSMGAPVQRFDHQDAVFARGHALETALQVSAGDDRTRYFVSGHWTAEEGVVRGSGAARRGVRVNATHALPADLSLEIGGALAWGTVESYEPMGSHRVVQSLVFARTDASLAPGTPGYESPVWSPRRVIDAGAAPVRSDRRSGRAALLWAPAGPFAARYSVAYDGADQRRYEYFPAGDGWSAADQELSRDSRLVSQELAATLALAPSATLALDTDLSLGRTTQRASASELGRSFEAEPRGVVTTRYFAARDLRTDAVVVQQRARWRDRLFVAAGARWERTPWLTGDRGWAPFPMASAAYVLRDAPADARGEGWLGHARLRAAWGRAQRVPLAQTLAFAPASMSSVLADPKPETYDEVEVGADLTTLRGRVQAEVTLHDRRTRHLWVPVLIPDFSGYDMTLTDDGGAISNRGVELSVRGIIADGARFGAATTLGAAALRNRVTALRTMPLQSGGGGGLFAGEPAGALAGSYIARDCVTGDPLLNARMGPQSPELLHDDPEQRRVLSRGDCNAALYRGFGSPNPTWQGSLLQEIRIGGRWRAHALIGAEGGHQVLNRTRQWMDYSGTSADASRELLPADDPARLPAGYVRARALILEPYVEDGDAVRLREIALSYTLDHAAVRRLVPGGAQLTLAGHDLAVWTRYSGFDPGATRPARTALDRGSDDMVGPTPRSWSLAARLRF